MYARSVSRAMAAAPTRARLVRESGITNRWKRFRAAPEHSRRRLCHINCYAPSLSRRLFFLGLGLVLSRDLLLHLWRDRLVVAQFHGEGTLPARHALELRLVLHDLGKRREGLHLGHAAGEDVGALDAAAFTGE